MRPRGVRFTWGTSRTFRGRIPGALRPTHGYVGSDSQLLPLLVPVRAELSRLAGVVWDSAENQAI